MNGRGRVLIFRKVGLEKAACPSLDRREHWAIFSANSEVIEAFPPSEAPSPLPPSSPASWWYSEDEENTNFTIVAVESVTPSQLRITEDGVVGTKRKRTEPIADTDDEQVVTKKPNLGDTTHSTALTREERFKAHGTASQPIVLSSDPVPLQPDHSLEVEVVESSDEVQIIA
ncbi:hypothetical protein MSAN_00831600 [Mycena sanguinolenta]|uniref:Uncharacterized protein n=1 Tax=Mycena sanguinolenta TaxID=230812 RepID=A0A8H6YYM2_9AGAR|nr:hypothetical protein MSAN_00831600 [Mycena sanguinolenta]